MRLLNAETLRIHEFFGDERTPPLAILSHTWGDEECILQDMADPSVRLKAGYAKIKYCCNQALKDELQWAWVDTCCIYKTSTAELTEAINSMFKWYRRAMICYAYLSDVSTVSDLEQSRWFTCGWTLQELVAPKEVLFYSLEWELLGSKLQLIDEIWKITNIGTRILSTADFSYASVATKMSWAAERQTTRVEDLAYCLKGIFDVNMPLLYGEGAKSFLRLQEEILKVSDDHSLFAWGLLANIRTTSDRPKPQQDLDMPKMHGLFADSPADFTLSHQIQTVDNLKPNIPLMVTNNGVYGPFVRYGIIK